MLRALHVRYIGESDQNLGQIFLMLVLLIITQLLNIWKKLKEGMKPEFI